ncbi:hypothetical protein LTR53_012904 [Teratosphaeriaceae sp. CCFEE 6253]|nr:hypothetical protein LTR53_012904 [Teratosphaeriaceae sp. CCFEE 6253]
MRKTAAYHRSTSRASLPVFGTNTAASLPMPPASSSASPSEASATICEQCGTNTGLERIDATKLNSLLESLTSRLSRDVNGNFFVEGSKTGKDTRYGQLGDLFSLMSRLEGFKTIMDKYITLHTPKEVVKPEKPVSINQNIKAVVAELVEQQVATRLRDLSVRCDRLEDAQAKQPGPSSKKTRTGFAGAVESVKYDHSANKREFAQLKAEIAAVAKVQAKHEERKTAPVSPFFRTSGAGVERLGSAINNLEEWREGQDVRVLQHEQDVAELRDSVAENEAHALRGMAHVRDLRNSVTAIKKNVAGLEAWKAGVKGRTLVSGETMLKWDGDTDDHSATPVDGKAEAEDGSDALSRMARLLGIMSAAIRPASGNTAANAGG